MEQQSKQDWQQRRHWKAGERGFWLLEWWGQRVDPTVLCCQLLAVAWLACWLARCGRIRIQYVVALGEVLVEKR